jgi:Leucine-rich repeat (LRR) protein
MRREDGFMDAMPLNLKPNPPKVTAWLGGVCCLMLCTGCGLPTWTELIGAKKDEGPVFVPPPPPVKPVIPTQKPEPPPPPIPAEVIGQFRELKGYAIDDAALGSLLSLGEGLEEIRELDLQNSRVTNAGLTQLGKLTHLSKLDVRNSPIDKDGASHIAQATSLEELTFDGRKLNEAGVQALRPLSSLRVLGLRGVQLPHSGFAELLHHQELEELDLQDSSMDDLSLDIVAELPKLSRLRLSRTRVTDEGVARLAKLDLLEVLELQECQVTGEAFGVIFKNKGMKSLKELNLTGSQLNERGAKSVQQMVKLERLSLAYLGTMQDVHFALIVRGMKDLTYLHVGNCPLLTSQGMMVLKGHKNLERLELGTCPRIDDAVFNALMTCKNLKHLGLGGTNCSHAAAVRFKALLPECEITGLAIQ